MEIFKEKTDDTPFIGFMDHINEVIPNLNLYMNLNWDEKLSSLPLESFFVLIYGRSLLDSSIAFYEEFFEEFNTKLPQANSSITIVIFMDYMNTIASKYFLINLFQICQKIKVSNYSAIKVIWISENEDVNDIGIEMKMRFGDLLELEQVYEFV